MPSTLLAAVLACSFLPVIAAESLRLIEVDPGHGHAAALHETMLPGFSDEAHVYAPLGPELTAHLARIAQYNRRANNPTHWSLKIFASPDYLQKMLEEPPGNVVVLAGKNDHKIDYILAALRGGQNVLADKPWIIDAADFPRLETALNLADEKGLVAYDCMTQRFDVAYQLQRQLMSDPEIFGVAAAGSPDAPSVRMENLHALLKMGSGGKPGLRPAWYLDIRQQGEGIADVGTHLVDLLEWTLFPDTALDYRRDIHVLRAKRWPTVISRDQFELLTAEKPWPAYLREAIKDDRLQYFTNTTALFSIRGIYASVTVKWDYEAAAGVKDSYFASYQGTKCRIEVRERAAEHYVPEVYLIPADSQTHPALLKNLKRNFARFTFEENGGEIHVIIPAQQRGNDNTFALLSQRFLGYVRDPKSLPAWEKPNMLVKYAITTGAVKLARETQ